MLSARAEVPALQAQAERLGVPQKEVRHFGRRRSIESVEIACTPSDSPPQETVAKIAAVPGAEASSSDEKAGADLPSPER